MKVKLTYHFELGNSFLMIEGDEFLERLGEKLRALGLRVRTTASMFGNHVGEYYREENTELYDYLKSSCFFAYRVYDDINEPVIKVTDEGRAYNLAIFRVVPKAGRIIIPVNVLMSVLDMEIYKDMLSKVYTMIMNAIDKEVTVVVQ